MGARVTKTVLAGAVAGAMLAMAATPSQAQGPWYGSITGNAVWLSDSDWATNTNLSGNIEYDTGWGIDGSLGYYLTGSMQGLRVEGEVGYRSNDLDKFNVNNFGLLPGTTGDVELWTGLLNVYYDFNIGSNLTPYVGGGLGIARYSANITPGGGFGGAINDNDTVFAYQLSAGVGYALSPTTTLFGGYRYLATRDPSLSGQGVDIKTEYASHNVQGGVRFSF